MLRLVQYLQSVYEKSDNHPASKVITICVYVELYDLYHLYNLFWTIFIFT